MSNPAYTSESPAVARDRIAMVAAAKAAKPAAKKAAAKQAATALAAPAQQVVQVLQHPDLPQVTVQFEKVTPEIAKAYLGMMPDWQRNESDKTTDEYAEDMLDEDWLFTGDSIKFTAEGEFFDGQHRAWAIYNSGQPQTMLVVRGLDRSAMRVLDTGYQRRFTNYLSTQKVPYVQDVANLTGKVLDWRRGNYAHPSIARQPSARHLNAKKSHQKLIHTFESMRDEIVNSVIRGGQIRRNFPGSAPVAVFAFAYLYLGRLDPYKRETFFDELAGKTAMSSASPCYPIRALEKTLVGRSQEKGIPSYTWLNWIFLAWNEWDDEQELSKERFRNIRKPRWDWLVVPKDPNALAREEGWEPL
jgi:hypothetical protein